MACGRLCFIVVLPFIALGADDSATAAELGRVQQRFMAEYRACTGDSVQAFDSVFRWKKELNRWADSCNYREVVHEYSRESGDSGQVVPCRVREWFRQRQRRRREEDSISRVWRAESLIMAAELSRLQPSAYDFDSIPFGVSRATFWRLFRGRHSQPPQGTRDHFVVKDLVRGGVAVMAAFHFDATGGLYKYEYETDPKPADSLNRVVRPRAKILSSQLESRLGRPDRTGRIGLFDIVQGRLAPYTQWENETHGAYVGLATHAYQYYAKVIVVRKPTSP